jgi:hypothetical protein
MRFRRPLLVALTLTAAACGSDTPPSPTSPTTTATVAPATLSATYNGTLPIGGVRFYSFTVVQNGTVNLTLVSLGQEIPADIAVELSLGRPAGTGCAATTTVNVTIETAAPHITGTFAPGVYCTRVVDTGNLPSTASFVVAIEHS